MTSEGAKFWAGVCAELANRGVSHVLIVCGDGLTGFGEAIEATWRHAMVHTCVVHLIRAWMRFVSSSDRKAVAAMLTPIYTAVTEDAALIALAAFADSNLGKKYPAAVASWENAWDRFTPVLAFAPGATQRHLHDELDRVAELPAAQDHHQPRPLPQRHRRDHTALAGHPQHRGHQSPRTRQGNRTTQKPPPQGPRQARSRGSITQGCKAVLGELALIYPERINPHL